MQDAISKSQVTRVKVLLNISLKYGLWRVNWKGYLEKVTSFQTSFYFYFIFRQIEILDQEDGYRPVKYSALFIDSLYTNKESF